MSAGQLDKRLCIVLFYAALDFDEGSQVVYQVSVVAVLRVQAMLLIGEDRLQLTSQLA